MRPTLLVDRDQSSVSAVDLSRIGRAAPWGRERVLAALKLNNNPPRINIQAQALADPDRVCLRDPDGGIIGAPGLWIQRLIQATRTRNTRGL